MAVKKKVIFLENGSATSGQHMLSGGLAVFDVVFDADDGEIQLQRLRQDGNWYELFTAYRNDSVAIHLCDGTYRVRVISGTGIYAQLVPTVLS